MAKQRWIQRSFNGGAWGEAAVGRSDLTASASALREILNFIPKVAGSAAERPGTLYVASTKNPTEKARLIPFVFNTGIAYVIELGHLYARFYKNDDTRIEVAGVPVEIATPWTESQLEDIQWSHHADTLVVTHSAHQPRLIQRTSDTSWTISLLTFRYGPYLSRNEVEPNVIARQTANPQFAAKLDIPAFPGLTRKDYRVTPATETVTADGPSFEAGRDEGRLLVMGDGNDNKFASPAREESFAVGTISVVNSTTSVDVDFFDGVLGDSSMGGSIKPTVNWWMQAYYASTSKRRWPACCTFAQERLWLGGGESGTDLLHYSRLGSIDDFDSWAYADVGTPPTGNNPNTDQHTILDSSGALVELSYPEVSEVRWLRGSKKKLAAGSSRVVFIVAPPENDGFSPNVALDASPTAVPGSAQLPSVAINERLHFVSSTRRQLQRIAFSLEADAYVPADLTQLNADVLNPGARDIAVALQPEPIVWLATDDGRLVGGTIDEASNVVAWHEHQLGGRGVDQDWGEVESVAVVPSADGIYEQLWMVVRRTVNGAEVRFVERMDRRFEKGDGVLDQRNVDARGPAYSGAPTTVYTVGAHLIGESVDILADGGADAPQMVDGAGQVTLGVAASDIVAGLPYSSRLRSLPPIFNSRFGLTVGEKYRFVQVIIRLVRSLGGRLGVGREGAVQTRALPIRQSRDETGSPPPLFSGTLVAPASGESTEDPQIVVEHSGPTHFEVAVLGALLDASDSDA